MASHQDYLLGMEPNEVRRLAHQHVTWQRQTEGLWELAGFAAGDTIVDLGCGPGFTSLDLARLVGPAGRVIGVDSSSAALEHLRATIENQGIGNIDIVAADVTSVDLSQWNPDGVFIRWVLCFLQHPEEVVQQVASHLETGATIAVMDYWNYLAVRTDPGIPLFAKVFRAVYDSFADAGGSLEVAGRLVPACDRAGLSVTAVEPLCQVGRPGSPVWRWLTEFQHLYLPTLVDKGYLTATELAEYEASWQQQETNNQALLFAPPLLGVAGVKR
jgi:SAM-dependent methyltransferase